MPRHQIMVDVSEKVYQIICKRADDGSEEVEDYLSGFVENSMLNNKQDMVQLTVYVPWAVKESAGRMAKYRGKSYSKWMERLIEENIESLEDMAAEPSDDDISFDEVIADDVFHLAFADDSAYRDDELVQKLDKRCTTSYRIPARLRERVREVAAKLQVSQGDIVTHFVSQKAQESARSYMKLKDIPTWEWPSSYRELWPYPWVDAPELPYVPDPSEIEEKNEPAEIDPEELRKDEALWDAFWEAIEGTGQPRHGD